MEGRWEKGNVDDVAALGLTNTVDLVKSTLPLSLKSQVISALVLGDKKENCRPAASTLHKVSSFALSIQQFLAPQVKKHGYGHATLKSRYQQLAQMSPMN